MALPRNFKLTADHRARLGSQLLRLAKRYERAFTERLARQHAILQSLRQSGLPPNISSLSRQFRVSRKTILRDIRELIHRGQLDSSAYEEVLTEADA